MSDDRPSADQLSEEEKLDRNRRHFLSIAAAVTGGVGIAAAAVPFLGSLQPSARARALGAPVEVAVGDMDAGEMVRVVWRGHDRQRTRARGYRDRRRRDFSARGKAFVLSCRTSRRGRMKFS